MNVSRAQRRQCIWTASAILSLIGCLQVSPEARSQQPGSPAQEPVNERVTRLILELDADLFSVREAAEEELGEIGLPALNKIRDAARSHRSAEVRRRARRLVGRIEHQAVAEEFKQLAAQEDDSRIDVEQGMLLICRIVDPLVDQRKVTSELDQFAAQVRELLGKQVRPQDADPQQAVKALQQVLFVKHALAGNRANYDNPENSSLARVLETRQGLPIILSHLAVAVGRRLDLPLVGLPVPGHYMLKYDGDQAPDTFAKQDIILDAYDAGRVISRQEVEELITRRGFKFDPQQHLQPSSNRAVLVRMLANLASDYAEIGQVDKAQQVAGYRTMLEGEAEAAQ